MPRERESIYHEHDNEPMRRHRIEFFLQSHPHIGVVAPSHIHSSVELLFVSAGHYRAELDRRVFSLSPGDLLLVRPGVIHSVLRTGGVGVGEYYVLKVASTFMHSMLTSDETGLPFLCYAVSRPDDACLFSSGSEAEQCALPHIREMIREYESKNADSMIAIRIHACALLLELCRLMCRDAGPLPELRRSTVERIHESLRTIDARYAEPLSPVACAADVCMSYSAYAHAFRAVTGKTFKAYLTEVRLRRAEEKILDEGCSVTDAAFACGYGSVSYFIKEYKRLTGHTPDAHRRALCDEKPKKRA